MKLQCGSYNILNLVQASLYFLFDYDVLGGSCVE
jgi:hypothetical protein